MKETNITPLSKTDAEILLFLRSPFFKGIKNMNQISHALNVTYSYTIQRSYFLCQGGFITYKDVGEKRCKYPYLTKKGEKLAETLFKLKELMK